MNEKITKRFITAVKRHNARKLHDQAWHDFNSDPRVEAVNYAIYAKSQDIQARAEAYLRTLKEVER